MGSQYRVYPLRQSPKRRQASGLLAIRGNGPDASAALDAEPWSDLARAVVETDLAAVESLGDERQRSRRLTGALRFIEYITETTDAETLARALVQAAAVWYDVDARLYRRDLTGDFVLETWLPGVQPDAASARLSAEFVRGATDLHRLGSAGDFGEAGAGQDALIVPLAAARRPEWILALIGSVPADADVVLRLVARIAGAQFAIFAERRAEEAACRVRQSASRTRPEPPSWSRCASCTRWREAVEAASGSLSLTRKGLTRRIAAVGPVVADTPASVPEQGLLTPERLVCGLALGGDDLAVLDLHAAPGQSFGTDDGIVARACASALRTWLAGTLTSFDATAAILDVTAAGVPPFFARAFRKSSSARAGSICGCR